MRESDFFSSDGEDFYFWRTVGKVIVVIVVLALVFGIIGWLGGWFNKAREVTGAENTSSQYAAIIGDWESLITSANNACGAQRSASDDSDPTMVEDPALAYAATFRKISVDFNRRQANLFEAKIVGPKGYPKRVPYEDKGPDTNWCEVASTIGQYTP